MDEGEAERLETTRNTPVGNGDLTAANLRLVEGVARVPGRQPCPACGRPVLIGQEIVMTLGDLTQGKVGVTIHQRCYRAIGRIGLLDLMAAAYRQRNARARP